MVATVCKEIGLLADEIDRIVGVERQKVTLWRGSCCHGPERSSHGFVDRPLYLFPGFMGTNPVEILTNKPSR
ncbi:hypothetical protein DRN80_06810 [Methanosarcinales archaeon]|nr:DUF4277 domain-containing protein [Methanophagales archaeon]RLG31953.1 MAG: hypothetical protein DRN80_06810 [Methanosarcinales archaeon]